MYTRLDVQRALACLKCLEEVPAGSLDAVTLSRHAGIPYVECKELVDRFETAGFITVGADGELRLTRPIHEFTSLDVIQAVWSQRPAPKFRLLYAQGGRQALAAKQAVAWAQEVGAYPSDGSVRA